MIEHNNEKFLTVNETCQVLDKSLDSVRQLLFRKRFKAVRLGGRVYLRQADVLAYSTERFKLPSYEQNYEEHKGENCYSLQRVASQYKLSKRYLRMCTASGKLRAYVTFEGNILVPHSAVEQFIGAKINEPIKSESELVAESL